MKIEAARILEDYAHDGELTVYPEYSCRGMYGPPTAGVVGPRGALERALAGVLITHDTEVRLTVSNALCGLRQDSMGRDTIWY